MNELEKLQQEIEALKKENAQLRETLETIENINRANEIGQYIQQRKRALLMANLMNTVSAKKMLNEKQLKDEAEQATEEKTRLIKRLKKR